MPTDVVKVGAAVSVVPRLVEELVKIKVVGATLELVTNVSVAAFVLVVKTAELDGVMSVRGIEVVAEAVAVVESAVEVVNKDEV